MEHDSTETKSLDAGMVTSEGAPPMSKEPPQDVPNMDHEETPNQRSRGPRNKDNGRSDGKRKRRDMGRAEWSRTRPDKRARIGEKSDKKSDNPRPDREPKALPSYATQFAAEEIAAEDRRPKKKVAVLIGYSGSGYKGMQLTPDEKTIEGDLFAAFVAAGAISKANANDPKKSSLVRCARTDKGVHASGNIVSLKLIVEDEDIVQKINEHLSPQIRVWGIQRTNNAFSCYQMCDSRVYEYLIPTHCFLPPHPSSYLGKKLVQFAEEAGDLEGYRERQEEVSSFWDEVEKETIQPFLEGLDATTREVVERALYAPEKTSLDKDVQAAEENVAENGDSEDAAAPPNTAASTTAASNGSIIGASEQDPTVEPLSAESPLPNPITAATKDLRAAYRASKISFRLPSSRLQRIIKGLSLYNGTHNYHNYTVEKIFRDPSAQRVIKSFVCSPTPILINGTEWLSLKVHGQSFMMHQIRKMVGMVTMAVRCGADVEKLVKESYKNQRMSIPKAPGLGLLLERPIFDSWNQKAAKDLGREPIDFGKFEKEIDEFKQREIYERIFREEEKYNGFQNLFNHIDSWQDPAFLWVSSMGIEAVKSAAKNSENGDKADLQNEKSSTTTTAAAIAAGVDSEDEDVVAGAEEG